MAGRLEGEHDSRPCSSAGRRRWWWARWCCSSRTAIAPRKTSGATIPTSRHGRGSTWWSTKTRRQKSPRGKIERPVSPPMRPRSASVVFSVSRSVLPNLRPYRSVRTRRCKIARVTFLPARLRCDGCLPAPAALVHSTLLAAGLQARVLHRRSASTGGVSTGAG